MKSDKTAGWGLNVLLRGDECGQFIVAGQAAEYVRPDRGCYCHPVSGYFGGGYWTLPPGMLLGYALDGAGKFCC